MMWRPQAGPRLQRGACAALALTGLTTVLMCAATFGFGVDPAGAAYGRYKVLTCSNASLAHQTVGADVELKQPAPTTLWQVQDQCPSKGVVFVTDQAAPFGTHMAWGFNPWLKSQGLLEIVEQVDFSVSGGSNTTGLKYELNNCFACTGGGSVTAPGIDVTVNASIFPSQAQAAYFHARCTTTTCAATPNLAIQNIVLHLQDDQRPTSQPLSLRSVASGVPIVQSKWQKPELVALAASGSDAGAGLQRLRVQMNDSTLFESSSDCLYDETNTIFYTQARLCQASRSINQIIDFAQIADGKHTLWSEGRDAVGQSYPSLKQTLLIDGTAPAEPRSTHMTGAQGEWTSQELFDLEWLNVGETDETQSASGLAAAWYDIEPQRSGTVDPPPMKLEDAPYSAAERISLPHDGIWEINIWTEDKAGNSSTQDEIRVGRDMDPPAPPILLPNPWVNRSQVARGYEQRWEPAVADSSLESGICGYSIGASQAPGPAAPDVPNAFGATASAQVPSDLPEGTNYVQVSAFSCAGLQSTTSTAALRVDGTGPRLGIAGLPTTEWTNKPLQLSLSATDVHSGTKSLWYSLNFGPRVTSAGHYSTVTLGDGVHALLVGAEDFTGNESATKSSLIKVDSAPPVAQFDPRDPTEPTAISASIKDSLSGVASAWMQYKRVDSQATMSEGSWTNFGHAADVDPESRLVTLQADLPDEKLPDGIYALRVVARDVAGNESLSSATRPDGAAMQLQLPARRQVQLTAEIASVENQLATATGKPCTRRSSSRKRSSCRRRSIAQRNTATTARTFDFNAQAAVVGQLRISGQGPLANTPLTLSEVQLYGGPIRTVSLMTDATGAFEYRPKSGPGRTISVQFAGSRTLLPSSDAATMYVRAGLTFSFADSRVRAGREVAMRGRLLSAGSDLPRGGKLAIPEFWNGNSWQLAFHEAPIASNGSFRLTHTFSNASGKPVRVAMRVHVNRETGWPYETGVSPVRWITVLPH